MSGESPDVYTITHPKARKEHRCCECHGVIRKGETYLRFDGIWLGKGGSYATCPDCEKIRDEVVSMAADPDEWPAFGELHRDCEGYGGELEERFRANQSRRAPAPQTDRGEG